MIRLNIALLGLFITRLVFAQDYHWSNANIIRAIVNPAENAVDTGIDASLLYRNQWKSVMTPFSTIGINVNYTLPKRFGVGITLIDDKAGSVGWHRTNAMLNVNYGLQIKKIGLRVGVGFGLDQHTINSQNAIFPDQINPDLSLKPTAESFNNQSNQLDNTLGIFAAIPIAKKTLTLGANYNHFLKKKSISFFGSEFKEYKLLNVQAAMALPINANWTAKPYVNYQNQGSFYQAILGSTYHYTLQQNEFFTGISYRFNDALIGQAGFFIKNIRAGISYDYTISSIRANAGGTGAVEIFAGYHFRKKETDNLIVSKIIEKEELLETKLIDYAALVLHNQTKKVLTEFSFTLKDLDKNLIVLENHDLAISEIKSLLNPCTKYEVTVTKPGYLTKTRSFSTQCNSSTEILILDSIALEPLEVNRKYALNNIYYEYDKIELTDISKNELENLFALLYANPTMVIELASHTDNRGTEEYNQILSEKRAQICVNYLIELGVNADRVQAKGYGESAPIAPNENEDGSDNEVGRAKNRRTEFKIISF